MSLANSPLPSDPLALRIFAAGLQAELARKDIELAANAAEIHAKTLHIEKLKMQLAVLRRARFGRSSEKLDREIEQLELLIGALEEDAAADDARAATSDPAADRSQEPGQDTRMPPTGPRPLPEHLPRETVTHEPACTCPGCGGTTFSRIGEDEREVLEYVPSSFKVIQHIRPKLSCRSCETIVQAPMPSLPIERGLPGPGLIAHVLVSKFADHTPLHRQAVIYAREGVELDRATLADWMGKAEFLLAPLAEAIGRHVRAGGVLHADDTTVPVLAPGLGKTKTGRLWVVVRDERPWGSTVPPAAFYRYSPDRKGIHAEALLGTCRGFLHADGYSRVRTALSADHARWRTAAGRGRMLEPCPPQVLRGAPRNSLADRPGGAAADRRLVRHREPHPRTMRPIGAAAARAEHAQPLLEQLKAFLEASLKRISGKSSLATGNPLCPVAMDRR